MTRTVRLFASYTAMTRVGMDVAKDHLDLAIRFESGEVDTRRFENNPKDIDPKDIDQLKERLCETDPERVVLSGSFWRRPVVTNGR